MIAARLSCLALGFLMGVTAAGMTLYAASWLWRAPSPGDAPLVVAGLVLMAFEYRSAWLVLSEKPEKKEEEDA